MKDTVVNGTATASLAKDAVYKEVVVVGNGPSGIALSYMLAGNWPYWNADRIASHPDELLRARLNYAGGEKSLVQQDLESLADGLEGRSTNPVSLLLDSLQNPCADIGMQLPTMLQYRHHPERHIDHVVLGKGPPGGSWHRMDPNLRTLSLSTWMSLPGYDYQAWEQEHSRTSTSPPPPPSTAQSPQCCRHCATSAAGVVKSPSRDRALRVHKQHNAATCAHCSLAAASAAGAASDAAAVAAVQGSIVGAAAVDDAAASHQPQESPTETNNNNNNNLCDTTTSTSTTTTAISITHADNVNATTAAASPVTSSSSLLPRRNLMLLQRQVSKEVQTRALVSRVAQYYEHYVHHMGLLSNFRNDTVVTSVQPFVPDATGGGAQHQRARWIVRGKHLPSGKPFAYLCHSAVLAVGASDLPNRLGLHGESLGHPWIKHELPQLEMALENLTPRELTKLKPVLIIGAGLSAADAVTICLSSKVPVIHVYRNSSVGLDKMLPEAVYPEYHAVHKMMKESTPLNNLYTPLAEHTLVNVHPDTTAHQASHHITLLNQKTGEQRRLEVSYCAILIGSRPDLRLLRNINRPSSRLHPSTPPTSPKPTVFVNNLLNAGSPTAFEQISASLKIRNPLQTAVVAADHWLLGRRLSWLKSLCSKCRTFSLCNRTLNASSQHYQQRLSVQQRAKLCGHPAAKTCQCPTMVCSILTPEGKTQTITTSVDKSNPASVPMLMASKLDDEQQQQQQHIDDDDGFVRRRPSTMLLMGNDVTLQLGEDPLRPIDCKTNPIAVNKYTNEMLRIGGVVGQRRGMYAMGPLVGDNFVRFISGGALAITSALHREND